MNDERYKTGFKRLRAAIVDGIIFIPLVFVDRYLLTPTTSLPVIIAWQAFSIFIPIVYSVIAHYKYGQTIGKWVVGVKVVDVSEVRLINLRQSFLRDSIYMVVQTIGFAYYSFLAVKTNEPYYITSDLSEFAATPLFAWTLIELGTMLTNAKRRAMHDLIAKSVVVRTD